MRWWMLLGVRASMLCASALLLQMPNGTEPRLMRTRSPTSLGILAEVLLPFQHTPTLRPGLQSI